MLVNPVSIGGVQYEGGAFDSSSSLPGESCNDSGLYSLTGLIFIYSRCGARSDSEVVPGFYR